MRIGTWWNWLRDWWQRLKGNERLSLTFEAVIVLATTCYAIIALLQWSAMRESNRINGTALVLVQRAFITPLSDIEGSRHAIRNPDGTETMIGISLEPKVENTGTTPARHQRSVCGWRPFQGDLPKNFDFGDSPDRFGPASFIAAKTSTGVDEFMIGVNTLHAVANHQTRIYYWCTIIYNDIFQKPSDEPHRTEFCDYIKEVNMSVFDLAEKSVGFTAIACPIHNCADEECRGN